MQEASVGNAGMRIVKLLVGKEAQTIADLTRATGVTRTAVAGQLSELLAAGFVERTTERLPERGRPRNRYSATTNALLLLFGGNQQLVVHKRSCPFIGMFDDGRAVCYVDQEVMTAVVGRPVVRTACRHDGDPCCKFAINENGD